MPTQTGGRPRQGAPSGPRPNAFLEVLRGEGNNLREKYLGKPDELAEHLGIKLPKKPVLVMIELGVITEEEAIEQFGAIEPGLRELVMDVCLGDERNAVAVANRGGGKSLGVSFIEFYLWMILDYDALNLGGSELQAAGVYEYLLKYIEEDDFWKTLLRDEPQRERTYKSTGAWVRVLTASQKSVRSPHAGGWKKVKGKMIERGGVLVIDEEAEAEKDIVDASLATIDTARPSVNVRCSTFHNLEGSFQEVVDNHEEMGYKLYRWNIFDVSERCDCVGECQSPEPCFREDHMEDYIDPETGEENKRLIHKAYCGGRAMYADGWVQMDEIVAFWKRLKRNHNRWEIEAMGSRPSSAGFVIKDLLKFSSNITKSSGRELYVPGGPVTITVDWGTGNGAVEVWQEQFGGSHVLLHADLLKDNNETVIFGSILGYVAQYEMDLFEVAPDIGGGGNYFNKKLRDDHRLPVRDVNFATEKEAGVAAMNMMNEAGKIVIPSEHEEFIEQIRGWKRRNGRIVKGNDHLCDAGVCYFSRFIEELGVSRVRIAPRTFSSNGDVRSGGAAVSVRPSARSLSGNRPRVPIVRSFR
jgi:hypothetical protein